MSDLKKSFLSGSAIALASGVMIGLFGYLNRRFAANMLPELEYGFFYTIFSYVSVANLLSMLGVHNATFFLVPDFRNQGREEKAQEVFSWGLRYITIAIGCLTIISAIAIPFCSTFFEKYQVPTSSVWLALFMPLPFALNLFFAQVLMALKGFLWSKLLQVTNAALIFLGLWLFLNKWHLNTMIIAYSLSGWLVVIAFLLVIKKKYGFKFFTPPSKEVKKRVHSMGMWLLITGFGNECIYDVGVLLLSMVSTPQQIVIYNIALPIAIIVRNVAVVSGVFAPFSNELYRQNKISAIEKVLKISLTFTLGSLLILIPIFYYGGELIITILFGNKFIEAATCTLILSLGVMLWNGAKFYSDILASMQHEKISGTITIIVSFCSILSYAIFGSYYGALGAAWTVLIICALWMTTNFMCLKFLLRAKGNL